MVNKMADRSPERAREDYLKVIYSLSERRPARATDVARSLGVTRASVSKFKRQLERDKLIEPAHARSDALRLTKKGERLAVRMVRRHRLVETFLHATLDVPIDRVHSEAERIEHTISEDVCGRLERFLRYPATDPHGHRIPTARTLHAAGTEIPLSSARSGDRVLVKSLDDRDATAIRRLLSLGLLPGIHVRVIAADGEGVRVQIGRRQACVPAYAAAYVRCAPGKRRANGG
jgi:DtxR family transcriptional regulator, Mn-dependent transcriptional regulator